MPFYFKTGVGPIRYSHRIGTGKTVKVLPYIITAVLPAVLLHWWSIPVYALTALVLILHWKVR